MQRRVRERVQVLDAAPVGEEEELHAAARVFALPVRLAEEAGGGGGGVEGGVHAGEPGEGFEEFGGEDAEGVVAFGAEEADCYLLLA